MTKHKLHLRQVHILTVEIDAKTEEGAAARLKSRYLDGDTKIIEALSGYVVISNEKGVQLEDFDLPATSVPIQLLTSPCE